MVGVLIVYTPLLVYIVWSWRWLRRHSSDASEGGTKIARSQIWLCLLLTSIGVSIIISTILSTINSLAILLTYRLTGDEATAAQVFIQVVFGPAVVAHWILGLLPGIPVYYEAPLLYWASTTLLIAVLLLAVSFIQWLLFQRISVRSGA